MRDIQQTQSNSNDSEAKYIHEMKKLNETISYMFKKAKNLGTMISNFHEQHCISEKDLNMTREYVVNYDSSLHKMGEIFDKFTLMESQIKGPKKNSSDERLKAKSLKPVKNLSFNDLKTPVKNKAFSKAPTPEFSNGDAFPNPTRIDEIKKEFESSEKRINNFFRKNLKRI